MTACLWFSWTGRDFIGRLDPSVQMSDAPSEFDQSFPGLIPCIWQLAGFSFCESFGLCGQAYRKPVKRDQTMWSPHLKWQKRPQNAALLFPVPLCSGRRYVSISAAEAGRKDGRWLPVWLLWWCNRTHSVIRWPALPDTALRSSATSPPQLPLPPFLPLLRRQKMHLPPAAVLLSTDLAMITQR